MSMIRTVGGVFLIALSAGVAEAQQSAHATWKELLEARIRPAYRYTHPTPPGLCATDHLPERAYLGSPGHSLPIGRTWQPGPNRSRWEPTQGPSRPDLLEVRVIGLWCSESERSILVEADGYYLEVDVSQLAQVDERGALSGGILFVGPSSTSGPLAFREDCTSGPCRYGLRDGEQLAEEVRRAVALRRDQELREQEEVERRLEAQRAAQLQSAVVARARTDAVARNQLASALQRYGATVPQIEAILSRRVLVGMSPAMVRAAIGEPTSVSESMTPEGLAQVWSYPGRQVTIVGGRVVSIR